MNQNASPTKQPRLVVVSGGSRGLGLVMVQQLLNQGCAVATFARNATEETHLLEKEMPGRFFFLQADARNFDLIGGFLQQLTDDFGGIHGLINNAAIGQDHLLVHTPAEVIRSIIEINIEAPMMLTKMVVRHMMLQDNPGRIINISSICGSRGYPGLAVYSAAKGALDAFTRSLARELGERGILVNSIAPGFFESEMSAVLRSDQVDSIRRRTPTQQLTCSKEVVNVVNMLLFSDTNINGQTIFVDGGITT